MPYKIFSPSSVTPNMSHPLTHFAAIETHIYAADIKGKYCCIECILYLKSLNNFVLKFNYLFPLYMLQNITLDIFQQIGGVIIDTALLSKTMRGKWLYCT